MVNIYCSTKWLGTPLVSFTFMDNNYYFNMSYTVSESYRPEARGYVIYSPVHWKFVEEMKREYRKIPRRQRPYLRCEY